MFVKQNAGLAKYTFPGEPIKPKIYENITSVDVSRFDLFTVVQKLLV